MMIKLTNTGVALNEKPKQRETNKSILIWSHENLEFAFNPNTTRRFAILHCTYTTCIDMIDFIDNITLVDAIVLDWHTPKMQNTEPRALQKYTIDSKASLEFQCPDYFNGFLNGNVAKNSHIPYEYNELKKAVPKYSANDSEVSAPWWMIFRNKTNNNLVLQRTSIRSGIESVGEQLEKARICSDMILKSCIVDTVSLRTFCNSLFIITS